MKQHDIRAMTKGSSDRHEAPKKASKRENNSRLSIYVRVFGFLKAGTRSVSTNE